MWTFVSREPEVSPFALCQEPGPKRWSVALSTSAAVHVAVLLVLCWPKAPVFVKPNLLAQGEGGASAPEAVALYLPQDVQTEMQIAPKLALPSVRHAAASKSKAKKRHNVLEEEKAGNNEMGSTLGSSADGPAYGDEVKPALPVAFPDPQISRHEVPSGLQGDVVVEITIDVQGNVIETRLLQGVGHGIDEKVIAAAREWHFRPATRNGVAVPSKQDYRFHFPS
jgi:periplasmic protein TonB